MRILLDACIPRKLKAHIPGHRIWTARDRGWNMLDDGRLLMAMTGEIDVLITMDRNMRFQVRPFGAIVLRARSNRLPDLLPLVPELSRALPKVKPSQVIEPLFLKLRPGNAATRMLME
jgi:hypothetical protein